MSGQAEQLQQLMSFFKLRRRPTSASAHRCAAPCARHRHCAAVSPLSAADLAESLL
jgi:hypothetical protein